MTLIWDSAAVIAARATAAEADWAAALRRSAAVGERVRRATIVAVCPSDEDRLGAFVGSVPRGVRPTVRGADIELTCARGGAGALGQTSKGFTARRSHTRQQRGQRDRVGGHVGHSTQARQGTCLERT